MFKHFISLEWKAFTRSSSFGKSLGLKIFLAFMALYFTLLFLLLGIGLYPLMLEMFPESEPLLMVNNFLLTWLGFELGVRFMLQTLPVLAIRPLLVLPVRKRTAVNFVLIKSLFSFFNLLPLLVIVPFGTIVVLKSDFQWFQVLAWMFATYALSLCINYVNFVLKKKFADELKALLPYIGLVLLFVLLDYFGVLSISEAFGELMNFLILHPYLALVPVVMVFLLYKWNQRILESRFYLDDSLRGKVKKTSTRDFSWVRRFGDFAPYLQLDLKLIFRNKRPKTTVFLSIIILCYGLIFYPNEAYADMPAIFVFVGIFMTGIFMINFGQFIPAWDSSYYSLMMAQNIPLRHYLVAKASLISCSIVILAILTTPYVYFGWDILLINMACAIYNLGVNVPVLLYAGSFNRKRIDLEKSPFMNYQGTGAAQWLIGIPLMVLPILCFWLIDKFVSFEVATGILFGMGFIGLVLRNALLARIEISYRRNKYVMINGFKQAGE